MVKQTIGKVVTDEDELKVEKPTQETPEPETTETPIIRKKRKRTVKKSAALKSEKVIVILFNQILVGKFGKIWALNEDEVKTLSFATDGMVEKYIPELKEFGVELAFVAALLTVVAPRAYATYKVGQVKKKPEPEKKKDDEKK